MYYKVEIVGRNVYYVEAKDQDEAVESARQEFLDNARFQDTFGEVLEEISKHEYDGVRLFLEPHLQVINEQSDYEKTEAYQYGEKLAKDFMQKLFADLNITTKE